MWKLEYIRASNICSFRKLAYSPQQGVTTLIFGHNIDNENQQSNGSGKSTLIEAIALGITGSPLRKVRSEEIINDEADECCVSLRFSNFSTGEEMTIEREFYRKGTSRVEVDLKDDVDDFQIALPSVDAYNRYILEKLGITRDELYSSFILSKHRYQDFLSAPDKEKKEIINRFSNGILVDQAIEEIAGDLEPLQRQLRETDLEFAGIDGRIEMLVEQIRQEEETKEDKQRSYKEKVAAIKATISEKHNVIRDSKAEIARQNVISDNIEAVDNQLQQLEDSNEPLEACITGVKEFLAPISGTQLTDWNEIIATRKRQLGDALSEVDKWTVIVSRTSQKIADAERDLEAVRNDCRVFEDEAGEKYAGIMEEMEELTERQAEANRQIDRWTRRKRTLIAEIEILKARLAGTVTCPACEHRFLVSDNNFDVETAKIALDKNSADLENACDNLLDSEIEAEKVQQMQTHLKNELRSLASRKEDWIDKLQKAERALQAAEYEMTGNKFNLTRTQEHIVDLRKEIDDIRSSVFNEAYDIIDTASRRNESSIAELQDKIRAGECSIDTLEQTIVEMENATASQVVENLRRSLRDYRNRSSEVMQKKDEIEKLLNSLIGQQQLFVQFKGYLANTKINALSAMMNQVLVDLGSDLRVNLSGYTVLKSGDIREKISVSIIRNGMDAGSFAKFSEGEKSRVNIASIVAMQRLVNANCELGKGLDFLAIDELADAMDFDGLASVFATLNKLGLTALVVSHGLTSEAYPYRLTICKEDGESRIGG